ncbi:putative oxidoreductase [Smittium mucronatum]|uniref:Putative oxidoreductase n=1 Tax=Smittium mucronatum TaxID=133383 RepID=A0A1R0H8C3_9FUNG|nr:putative oxidoreductase [Smittium mucronatum]
MSLKSIIVTGASRGIGKATCAELLKQGANVTGFARNEKELSDLSREFENYAINGAKFEYFVGDITDESACRGLIEFSLSKFGKIDGLVNNAGTLDPLKKMSEITKDEFKLHFDVNFFSVLYLTQQALPYLSKTHGRVINISSGAATYPYYSWGAYCNSKAALNMMTACLALEEPSVTFLSLRPGVVDTAMQSKIRSSGDSMRPQDLSKFVDLHATNKLLDPKVPGSVIANTSLRLEKDLSGKFLSWDSTELSEYR